MNAWSCTSTPHMPHGVMCNYTLHTQFYLHLQLSQDKNWYAHKIRKANKDTVYLGKIYNS
jgi:hypothetical protein